MSGRWIAAAFAVFVPWLGHAQQNGMIDANVTIIVSNPSLIKSQTTVFGKPTGPICSPNILK